MLTGVETAELLTQQAWQHGDDLLHQVHACGSGLGLFVQRTALPAPKCAFASCFKADVATLHSAVHRCKIRLGSSDSRLSQPSREAQHLVGTCAELDEKK